MLPHLPDLSSLPRSVSQRLRTFGHALARLEIASDVLRRRFDKGQTVLGLTPEWFENWSGNSVDGERQVHGARRWSASIELKDKQWVVTGLGEAGGISTSCALVLMQLHLPVLRDFWRKELRAHRAALLQRVLPRVWPLEPAPLPPGAVIGGLRLSSWTQLPQLLSADRTFEVLSLAGRRQPVTAAAWPQILAQAGQEKLLLLEHPHLPEGSSFAASWSANADGWIDLDQQTF